MGEVPVTWAVGRDRDFHPKGLPLLSRRLFREGVLGSSGLGVGVLGTLPCV